MFNKNFFPIFITFLFTLIVIRVFESALIADGFDFKVLNYGNQFIFAITLLSVLFLLKALKAASTAQFLQYTYASILLKLFVCGIAAFIYIFTHRSHLNKKALFSCMALYLLYTFVERIIIVKFSKDRKNENKASA